MLYSPCQPVSILRPLARPVPAISSLPYPPCLACAHPEVAGSAHRVLRRAKVANALEQNGVALTSPRVESAEASLARRLGTPSDAVGEHVANFLARFEGECAEVTARLNEVDAAANAAAAVASAAEDAAANAAAAVASAAEDAAANAAGAAAVAAEEEAVVDVSETAEASEARADKPAQEASETAEASEARADKPAQEASETAVASEARAQEETTEARCEALLRGVVESVLAFETSLLEALYAAGIAQPIEQTVAGGNSGLMLLLRTVEGSFMPRCLELLKPLHARVRRSAAAKLNATRQALRLRHPEVLGLRESLVVSGGVPCTTVLEVSWLYGDAVDAMTNLPNEPTVAGKLATLARAFEALVVATRERCGEGLSADDLVPLLTLTLVASRIDLVAFEGFVVDELLSDVVASGREAYCACTLAVALGFLRTVELDVT